MTPREKQDMKYIIIVAVVAVILIAVLVYALG